MVRLLSLFLLTAALLVQSCFAEQAEEDRSFPTSTLLSSLGYRLNADLQGWSLKKRSGGSYHYDMDTIQSLASSLREMLGSEHVASLKSRLPVMVPFFLDPQQYSTPQGLRRWLYIVCNLPRLISNLSATTPIDLYLWLRPGGGAAIPPDVRAMLQTFVAIIVEAPRTSLVLPSTVLPPEHPQIGGDNFTMEDHITSRWRLTFGLPFLSALGYRVGLFATEDTILKSSLPYNLVAHMVAHEYAFAVRNKHTMTDGLAGLTELSKFWMQSRGVRQPVGPLLSHIRRSTGADELSSTTFLRRLSPSHFVAVDLHFWFQPAVQDFVRFVLGLGADVEEAYMDHGVLNMVRLLFVPDEHKLLLDCAVLRAVPPPQLLPQFGCAAQVQPTNTSDAGDWLGGPSSRTALVQTFFLQGEAGEDVLFFLWNCLHYEDLLGPCSSYANAKRSLAAYTAALCTRHALEATACQQVRHHAFSIWKGFW